MLTFLLKMFFGILLSRLHPNSDVGKTPHQMIENRGYPLETHYVTTEDQYILTLYRIPYQKSAKNKTAKRPAVLLGHGMSASSADYISMGPKRSLSYILSENGFDVWLLNSRETRFSRNHTALNLEAPNDRRKYFDFSWHEIGYYDLPAAIDYILGLNGDRKLHYVGHSQGTTIFYVMAAARPEYNSKIALASLMASAGIMKQNKYFVSIVKHLNIVTFVTLKVFKIYEIPFASLLKLMLLFGAKKDLKEWDWKYFDIITTNGPSSFATKQALHYGQNIKTFGFNRFDHGLWTNLKVYKQLKPPAYNLSNIVAPVALYYALNDDLSNSEDLKIMANVLPHVVDCYQVPYDKFNHLDFLFAHNVVKLLYNQMLTVMKKY